MLEFGADEAGKGPVLGSMFAAAVVADPADLPDDVGDSKGIRADRRVELADEIRERAAAVGVAEIPVERIDDGETDMNSLTVAAQAEALTTAIGDVDAAEPDVETDGGPVSGYVDACDTNAVRFERRVETAVEAPVPVDVRGEHGADENYAIVGAASVVAKVERDAHVERLAERHDAALGSGYPSDPATREFLESYVADNRRLPPCARSTWKTSRDALAAQTQSSLGEFDDEDEGRRATEATAEADAGGTDQQPTTLDEF